MELREQRKLDHIRWALELPDGPRKNGFEELQLVPRGINFFDYEEIDLSTIFLGKRIRVPLYINAMTGGAKGLRSINQKLAEVAKECQIPIAVGSQKAALENKEVRDTFSVVRQTNKDGIILANLSADSSHVDCQSAIEMLEADGLQLHLNLAQELVMGEGDYQIRSLEEKVTRIIEEVTIPIVMKEVGFGLSMEVVRKMWKMGIKYFDIGGAGGTNFVAIEQRRRSLKEHHLLEWGLPTAWSLLEVTEALKGKDVEVFASGGIRSGADVVKSLIIGANACGFAKPVLDKVIRGGVAEGVALLREVEQECKELCFLAGGSNIEMLRELPIIQFGETRQWMAQR